MKWFNLKSNRCPRCSKPFNHFESDFIRCGNCQFKITLSRFNSIVSQMVDYNRRQDELDLEMDPPEGEEKDYWEP